MCYAYLRLFAASAIACGLFVPVAQAAPVANLPLTCPDAGAIGQTNCGGLVYQSPTAQLIVLKGPSSAATWARASSLTQLRHRGCLYAPGGARYLFELQRCVRRAAHCFCAKEPGFPRFAAAAKQQFWCSCTRPHESRGDK